MLAQPGYPGVLEAMEGEDTEGTRYPARSRVIGPKLRVPGGLLTFWQPILDCASHP